ncbi:hypothetical protein ACFRAK_29775, partial [Peribacillus sp. NPDC056705]
MHRRRIARQHDQAFTLQYLGVPEADQWDAAAGKIVRVMRFGIYVPNMVHVPQTQDEWLMALSDWTASFLGHPWTIYDTAWPADRGEHAVLWRLAGYETKMAGASTIELRKNFTGHL